MTKIILRAQDEGDVATLDEIDRWGESYLRICHERESARRKDQKMWEAYEKRMAMQEEDRCGGVWAGAYPMQSPRRNGIRRFLRLINPYLLPLAIKNWRKNGRILNFWAILNAAAWLYAWWIFWGEIRQFESAMMAAGHTRDGWVSLVIVLARAAMILGILPIAASFGMVAALAALGTGLAWIGAWILGGICEYFHPWLVCVPYVIAVTALLIAAWKALENGLEEL